MKIIKVLGLVWVMVICLIFILGKMWLIWWLDQNHRKWLLMNIIMLNHKVVLKVIAIFIIKVIQMNIYLKIWIQNNSKIKKMVQSKNFKNQIWSKLHKITDKIFGRSQHQNQYGMPVASPTYNHKPAHNPKILL